MNSTLRGAHQGMHNNVYFPGLPQYNRTSSTFPSTILPPNVTPTGRRPRNGTKNDRCEFCGKVTKYETDSLLVTVLKLPIRKNL